MTRQFEAELRARVRFNTRAKKAENNRATITLDAPLFSDMDLGAYLHSLDGQTVSVFIRPLELGHLPGEQPESEEELPWA